MARCGADDGNGTNHTRRKQRMGNEDEASCEAANPMPGAEGKVRGSEEQKLKKPDADDDDDNVSSVQHDGRHKGSTTQSDRREATCKLGKLGSFHRQAEESSR